MNKFGFGLLVTLVAAAALIIGCGGGGASGGTGTTATTSTTSGGGGTIVTRMVAVNGSGQVIDPMNLVPNQSVTFKVAAIDASTNAIVGTSSATFSTTDTQSFAGTLNKQTGAYVAKSPAGGTIYTMSATTVGGNYSLLYTVTASQAIVTGTVHDTNGVAVPFARVIFYDGSGSQVGASAAGLDGTFTASVPASAVTFNLDGSTLPSTATAGQIPSQAYYKIFDYGTGSYSVTAGAACGAPVPTLTNGQSTALPNTIIVAAQFTLGGAANVPPPPPTCSQ